MTNEEVREVLQALRQSVESEVHFGDAKLRFAGTNLIELSLTVALSEERSLEREFSQLLGAPMGSGFGYQMDYPTMDVVFYWFRARLDEYFAKHPG